MSESTSSVSLSMIDDYSKQLNSMANANKGFSKSMEEIRQAALRENQALEKNVKKLGEMRTELQKTGKALNEAKKAFKQTGSKEDLDRLTALNEALEMQKIRMSEVGAAAKTAQKNLNGYADEARRTMDAANRAGGSGFGGGTSGGGLVKQLGQAGVWSAVGDMASTLLSNHVQSAFGDETSSYVSGALSMAGTGAAIGTAIAPGIGTAIGAALGGIAGVIMADSEVKANKDEYFKDFVKDNYDRIQDGWSSSLQNGTSIAAQREVDELAFNKLLGEDVGTAYLEDLRDLAAHTPLEYDQLTEISRQLAIGFGDKSDRMLELIEVVGDAGSAVGLDSGGMVTIATALSRMQSSDKVTLEYLNLIQERGIDAIGIIGQEKGMTTAEVYDAISKGTLDGSDVVDILQEGMAEDYGGSMEEQSHTYQGLQSTVQDINNERDAAMGFGYTEERKKGLQSEISWNELYGADMQDAYSQIGAFQASLENERDQILRNAMATVMNGSPNVTYGIFSEAHRAELQAYAAQYAAAEQEGDAAAMGEALSAAQAIAAAEYTNTEGYKTMVESQNNLITGIQAATADSYYTAGYEQAQQFSKGFANGFVAMEGFVGLQVTVTDPTAMPDPGGVHYGPGFAYGLDRVPYNGYIAQLHEGERVLTARQARQMDAAGGHAGGVVITGNNFTVREDADVTRIASELVRQIRSAQMVYAGG